MVRSRLETVRRPVVRIAATSRTRKRWQVGCRKTGANWSSNGRAKEGIRSMRITLVGTEGGLDKHPCYRRGDQLSLRMVVGYEIFKRAEVELRRAAWSRSAIAPSRSPLS